jgi:hypothetical protein
MKKPNFFIVGAPKCGTTAMSEYLKQHPEVFVPRKKELYYFGSDLLVFSRSRISEGEYLSYFAEARDEKRLGEASVWYLFSKVAASEIKEFCPSAGIIIMLRNPVDMIYSLHSQLLSTGNEDIEDFEAALQAEDDRKRGLRLPRHRSSAGDLLYRETAKYTDQIKRYLDVFGRENVHVIIFDDFVRDTALVYKQTCEFLKVNGGFYPEFRVVNPNKSLRSQTLLYLIKYPPPAAQRLGEALLPERLRRGLRRRLRLLNTRYDHRPTMEPELRRRLQAEFLPEVMQLSELVGRDLTHWCQGRDQGPVPDPCPPTPCADR